jgi:hypothetical protein
MTRKASGKGKPGRPRKPRVTALERAYNETLKTNEQLSDTNLQLASELEALKRQVVPGADPLHAGSRVIQWMRHRASGVERWARITLESGCFVVHLQIRFDNSVVHVAGRHPTDIDLAFAKAEKILCDALGFTWHAAP